MMFKDSARLFVLIFGTLAIGSAGACTPSGGDGGAGKSGGQGGQASPAPTGGAGGQAGSPDSPAGGQGGVPDTSVGGQGGAALPGGAGGEPPAGGMPAPGGNVGSGGAGSPGASTCPGVHPFCTDFEKFTVGARLPSPFSVASQNVQVVDDKAHSGKVSIRVAGGQGTFTLSVRSLLPDPKKIGYSRMMVWMENTPGMSANNHWSIIGLSGASSMFAGSVSFGGWGEGQRRMLYYAAKIPGAEVADCSYKQTGLMIPVQKWTCIEMGMDETQANAYSVKIDGQSVMSFKSTGSLPGCIGGTSNNGIWHLMDTYSAFWGFNHYHEQPKPVRLWIDDIAVSEKPIGCPAN